MSVVTVLVVYYHLAVGDNNSKPNMLQGPLASVTENNILQPKGHQDEQRLARN